MKTIDEMAREAGDDWDSTLSTDKEFLKRFAELVAAEARADEREHGQKWFDAVLEQHRIVVLAERWAGVKAEREACAKLIEPDEEHRRNPSWYLGDDEGVKLLDSAAAKIRARGNT